MRALLFLGAILVTFGLSCSQESDESRRMDASGLWTPEAGSDVCPAEQPPDLAPCNHPGVLCVEDCASGAIVPWGAYCDRMRSVWSTFRPGCDY